MRKINTDKLLQWYRANARDLPWRNTKDPYAIWVSEIMLQQTRVETVIPYYEKWLNELPELADLANADEDRVLSLWEGLGYYSRARNLHKAARQVRDQYNGEIPAETGELQKLPGIGRYTAAALSSIAFQKDAAALDGNIRRVLSRFFNITDPIRSNTADTKLWDLVEKNLPSGQAGDYNQALMELGARICTPANPDCDQCPLMENCLAFELGLQESRPVKSGKSEIPEITVTAGVIHQTGMYLIAKRPPDGLLGGMWEFPGGKQKPGETLHQTLIRELNEELNARVKVGEAIGTFQHSYTHKRVQLHAYYCELLDQGIQPLFHTDLKWVSPENLDQFPMGKLDRQISIHVLNDRTKK
jgi:A/G-specific adenine glycosylase